MSTGELVGLLSTALLAGLLIGAGAVRSSAARRARIEQSRRDRLDAYAGWLAARRSLSRASISLVAAFRALAAERPDAPLFSLRTAEAQRCRAAWCNGVRDLDLAEAALLVRCRTWRVTLDRAGADVLQAAIDGSDAEVRALVASLQAADRQVEETVRGVLEVEFAPAHRHAVLARLAQLSAGIKNVTDRWVRR